MTDQPTLPFQPHSDTSREAADFMQDKAATKLAQVWRYMKEAGPHGATDDEMQVGLQMNPSTQRPRRVRLLEMKLVRDSGRKRKTRSGRDATVWVVA